MGLFGRALTRFKRNRFAALLARAMRREGVKQPIAYDAGEFILAIGPQGGRRQHVFLANAYDEYRAASPSDRQAVLARWARLPQAIDEKPERYEEARARLLPRVRERSSLNGRQRDAEALGMEASRLPYHLLADHLLVYLVYDRPESMSEVTAGTLSGWGVTLEEAIEAATENLRRISAERLDAVSPGVFVSTWRDQHDASRLFLPDLFADYPVRGDVVAMIPNRNTLIVTGSDDREGQARMVELTRDALKKPRPMTGIPVRLERDRWVPFLPPQLSAFKRLRLETLAREYDEQKQLLEARHTRSGEDVFVAEYMWGEWRATGEPASFSTWSEGVVALLPQTEHVALMRPDQRKGWSGMGVFPWERVAAVAGGLMRAQGLYPERYRVEEFPSADQLEKLGSE